MEALKIVSIIWTVIAILSGHGIAPAPPEDFNRLPYRSGGSEPIPRSDRSIDEALVFEDIDKIDERRSWIEDNFGNLTLKDDGERRDYLEGDHLAYRQFYINGDIEPYDERFTSFTLYYDSTGSLIYAEVGHYRSHGFSIYLKEGQIFYIGFGPVDGYFRYAREVIEGDERAAFMLEDIDICLDNAYQPDHPADIDSCQSISEEDTASQIRRRIYERRLRIQAEQNVLPTRSAGIYTDYLEGDHVARRIFSLLEDGEWATFDLYYDETGALIYADIGDLYTHGFNIYVQDDAVVYVGHGPVNGDIAHVIGAVREDGQYAYMLEQMDTCLEHAYR